VADQKGSGAVAVVGEEEGEAKEALLGFALHGLKGDLFPELMDYTVLGGGGACVGAVPALASAVSASALPPQGRRGWVDACRIM
jgi:hypothetical protein